MHNFDKEEKTWFAFLVILFFTVLFIVIFAKPAQATPDCDLYPDASWCSGESMKECPQGIEVPEDWDCNSYAEADCLKAGGRWIPEALACIDQEPDIKECPDGRYIPEHNFYCANTAGDCENWERSARGYCLGDPDHQAEIDSIFEYDQTTRENSCELDGTCDDSCPHRADCLEGEFDWLQCQNRSEPDEHNMCPVPDFDRALPLDELPHTGISMPVALLALSGIGMLGGGIAALFLTRRHK